MDSRLDKLWERPLNFGRTYLARLRLFSRNVRLFLVGLFLAGFGFTFWQLLFNLYLQEAGYSKAFIGDALGLGNLAIAAAALPAGLIAGRLRVKPLLIVSQTLSFASLAAAILMPSSFGLIAFMALGFALITFARVVSGPFIMRNTTPVERPYVFSALFIIMLASGVGGNALGGACKDLLMGAGVPALAAYRETILIGVGVSFLGLPPFFLLKAASGEGEAASVLRLSEFRQWNWPLFGRALLPEALLSIGAGLIVQFMNLYFKDVFHSSDRDIGLYMSLQATTMVFGVLLSPMLAERFGKVRTIVTTQLLSLPFMLLLGFTDLLSLALAAFLVRSVLMNMSAPLANTLYMEVCRKEEQTIMNALFALVWSLSWAISSYIYGNLIGGDYTLSFVIAVALYAASSFFYFTFFRKVEQKQSHSPSDRLTCIME